VRIVVDASPLALPRTGIGNYLRGMLAGLAEVAPPEHELVVFAATGLPGRRRVEQALDGIPAERRLLVLPYARGLRGLWSRAAWPAVERAVGRLDVLHLSDWTAVPQRAGLRVRSVHDLVPLRFPEWTQAGTRRLHGRALADAARCDLVVANSRYTADDVVERLGLAGERVRVAYPGIDSRFRAEGPRAERPGPYLLAVSTLEPRKNLGVLLEAHSRLGDGVELVVAGAEGWGGGPELERPGVSYTGYVGDDELARLYRGAAAFAYPSRFEGFGIPVVEALASGTPVVASSHPSLDEACGDAALRADPDDPQAWADALASALEGDADRRARGLAHAARFTPRACGKAVLAAYRDASGRV
jgi:glycosyltransferase involved in cell wall biosynthesis